MAGGQGGRRHHRKRPRKPSRRRRKIKQSRDLISSMPDEILHQILSFTPTSCAIRTSVLSKRWRRVWRETTSIYIEDFKPTVEEINETLNFFTAPKIMSFHLRLSRRHTAPQIDTWIQFAMSRNVQNLSVKLDYHYSFPDFFYLSSSIKQLSVELRLEDMIIGCTVSWKHLRNLSLRRCRLGAKCIANIISGCPNLESLTLYQCHLPQRLDMSKSLSLKRLEIDRSYWVSAGPTEIVAPQIHYLKLKIYEETCTLVDVSSLTEANLDIHFNIYFVTKIVVNADFLQTMVLELLEKLQNVERLVVGATVLQILSLPELFGVPFQFLNVQTLIVETEFVRSVVPGIARLLQNSPQLKKLKVHAMDKGNTTVLQDKILARYLDRYWKSKYGVFPASRGSMLRYKDATRKSLAASFMELVLRNAKTLETMVVRLGGYFNEEWFETLLQMVPTLSHNTIVSFIMLKPSNC